MTYILIFPHLIQSGSIIIPIWKTESKIITLPLPVIHSFAGFSRTATPLRAASS